jgi:hypothetical protein
MKEEKNEKMEIYYERLLKLVNNLQHRTTNSFLITISRLGLCTTIFACSNNKHEGRNLVVA